MSASQSALSLSKGWFVYILLCEDDSFYTGYSDNFKKRFDDHKNGKGGKYTRSHKPLKIIRTVKLKIFCIEKGGSNQRME